MQMTDETKDMINKLVLLEKEIDLCRRYVITEDTKYDPSILKQYLSNINEQAKRLQEDGTVSREFENVLFLISIAVCYLSELPKLPSVMVKNVGLIEDTLYRTEKLVRSESQRILKGELHK